MPSSSAIRAIGRPLDSTSPTARSRNSGGYLLGVGTVRISLLPAPIEPGIRASEKAGEPHIAVPGIGLPGLSSAYGLRRRAMRTAVRCEPGTTMAVHSWRRGPSGSGAGALRFAPPRRGLLEERRDRRVNRQPATGGAGCRLDDAPARRGAGAPARLVRYERTARVFTTPRTPGPRPTAREGWADARDPAALS